MELNLKKTTKNALNYNRNVYGNGIVFNHDISDASHKAELKELKGVFRYSGRALAITGPNDTIQLHPDLKENWNWIIAHYDRIGLSCTKNVIWDDSLEKLKNFPNCEISVFIFGKRAHSVLPDEKWFNIVQRMNSKNEFMRLCKELSVKTPKTYCFNNKNEIKSFEIFDFPVYLKISTSVSGLGVFRCENEKELKRAISILNSGTSFQIQNEVKARAFINVQYRIDNDLCSRLLVTEQVLEGCQHAGNKFPTAYENVWMITDPIALKIKQDGMKGHFAFDLAVDQDGNYLAIECNPRYNGATYPTYVAAKLNIKEWVAKNIETTMKTINNLNLDELEYNPSKKSGVIVVNWGCVIDGKMGVLIAGTIDEQIKIEERLKKLL